VTEQPSVVNSGFHEDIRANYILQMLAKVEDRILCVPTGNPRINIDVVPHGDDSI
jgi:hypothetical protein